MSEILLEITRGPLVENIHRGDIAVVKNDGKLLFEVGDPFKTTYIRSALKPIQALNVILSGAVGHFGFDHEAVALMCASHYGQPHQIKKVLDMLEQMGLDTEALLSPPTYSIHVDQRFQQIHEHQEMTPAHSDCSGKHVGMLATCLMKGYPIEDYNSIDHPLQKEILGVISEFCKVNEEAIHIGMDGCGVPVHGIPLYSAALAYARLAAHDVQDFPWREAGKMVFEAMNAAPEMVAGYGGFCTDLIRHTHGRLIGKLGADGIYCVGVKAKCHGSDDGSGDGRIGMGIAMKIEDGNYDRAIPPVVIHVLESLDLLNASEMSALEGYRHPMVLNGRKEAIGEIRAVFDLNPLIPIEE